MSTLYSQVHNGSAQASVLRGVPAFLALALDSGGTALVGSRGLRDTNMRVMVINPVVVDYFQWCSEQPDVRTIADITFPADRPEEVFGEIDEDDELRQHDLEVTRDFWRPDGDNIALLRKCAELADAVTVPHMIWAPSFVDSRKVFELPNLVPGDHDDLHRFVARLTEIWDAE